MQQHSCQLTFGKLIAPLQKYLLFAEALKKFKTQNPKNTDYDEACTSRYFVDDGEKVWKKLKTCNHLFGKWKKVYLFATHSHIMASMFKLEKIF